MNRSELRRPQPRADSAAVGNRLAGEEIGRASADATHRPGVTRSEFRRRGRASQALWPFLFALAAVLGAPALAAPPSAPDRYFTVAEGGKLFVDLLAYATDPDGQELAIAIGSVPEGTLEQQPWLGVWIYRPAGRAGESDAFAYTVSDGAHQATGTVFISIVSGSGPGSASGPQPPDGASGTPTSGITLQWTPGSGATGHDVYFGPSSPPPLVSQQANVGYPTGGLEADTMYYWRVDERDGQQTVAGPEWHFTTGDGSGSSQASNPRPGNGATGVISNRTLAWTGGEGAVLHHVWWGAGSPYALELHDIWPVTHHPAPEEGWEYGETYYWRIDEEDESGGVAEGPLWQFTVMDPPTPVPPTQQNPPDGVTELSLPVTFSWSGGENIETLELYVVSGGLPPEVHHVDVTGLTETTLGELSHGATYTWYLIASNGGQAVWSEGHGFSTAPQLPPTAPTNLMPPDGASGVPQEPTLTWTAGEHADYHVVSLTFPDGHVVQNLVEQGTSTDFGVLEPGNTYRWLVTAHNDAGSASAAVHEFTVADSDIVVEVDETNPPSFLRVVEGVGLEASVEPVGAVVATGGAEAQTDNLWNAVGAFQQLPGWKVLTSSRLLSGVPPVPDENAPKLTIQIGGLQSFRSYAVYGRYVTRPGSPYRFGVDMKRVTLGFANPLRPHDSGQPVTYEILRSQGGWQEREALLGGAVAVGGQLAIQIDDESLDGAAIWTGFRLHPVEKVLLHPTDDAYVEEEGPGVNDPYLRVRGSGSGQARRALLRFDLSSVPGEVIDAHLGVTLEHLEVGSLADLTVGVTCTSTWSESTVDWSTDSILGTCGQLETQYGLAGDTVYGFDLQHLLTERQAYSIRLTTTQDLQNRKFSSKETFFSTDRPQLTVFFLP